jgi:hypothetical protein
MRIRTRALLNVSLEELRDIQKLEGLGTTREAADYLRDLAEDEGISAVGDRIMEAEMPDPEDG